MGGMSSTPPLSNRFAHALQVARAARGKSQESFDVVSSRTYVSSLERGLKSPTLKKIDDLASVLGLHPLTLLTLAYTHEVNRSKVEDLLELVRAELEQLQITNL